MKWSRLTRVAKLAAAAAAAKSTLFPPPIPTRGVLVTLGRALPCTAVPFIVLFTPVLALLPCDPATVECRFGPAGAAVVLLGDWLLIVTSRVLTAEPFLKLVAGGSGRGRVLAGVWEIEL